MVGLIEESKLVGVYLRWGSVGEGRGRERVKQIEKRANLLGSSRRISVGVEERLRKINIERKL